MKLKAFLTPQKFIKNILKDRCTSFRYNFIMQDNLQQALHHKRFIPIPRAFPTSRFQDLNGFEPWQKNTLEILIQEDPILQAKTFYHQPKKSIQSKYYKTVRGFSFRTERPFQPITKTKSEAVTSRKSAVSHYIINGNLLGDSTHTPKSLPFQLPCKPVRTMRQKVKSINIKPNQYSQSTLKGFQNLMEIKKKIKIQNQRSNKGFIHLNSQPDQQPQSIGNMRRKSKVITLGFQKLSLLKSERKKSNQTKILQKTL